MKNKQKQIVTSILVTLSLLAFFAALPAKVFAVSPSLKVWLGTDLPFYSQSELVKISGNVTDSTGAPVASASVALEVKDSEANTIFLDIADSYSNGTFQDSFRLPDTAPTGLYTLYATASKVGYSSGSNQTIFTVSSQHGIVLDAWTKTGSFFRFDNATIYGKLLINGTAVQNATITFHIIFPNQTIWLKVTNITAATGIAAYVFYLPPTIPAGLYEVNASSYIAGLPNGKATSTFTILNKEPVIHQVIINPQIIEKPGIVGIEANASDFEDGLSLKVTCIVSMPNGTIQVLNMSLVNSLFRLQYLIASGYPAGTYSITIMVVDHDGGSSQYQTTLQVITPVLEGAVYGTVTTKTGQAIPNATLTLSLTTAYLTYSTTTNALGYYNFSKAMPGNYNLIISAPAYATQTPSIKIVGNTTTLEDITLSHLPVLKGTVSTQSLVFILNASITVTGSQGIVGQATTSLNGSYTVVLSSAGIFTATASAFGYSSNSTSVICSLDQTAYASFRLIRDGKLAGTVKDQISKAPVVDATITLLNSQFVQNQNTNSTGGFIYNNLSPGTYSLIITASNYESNATTINVYSNQTTLEYLLLLPTSNITGVVRDASTNGLIQGAFVSLLDYRGVPLAAVYSNSSGGYLFYLVPPANYTIEVYAYGYKTNSTQVDLGPHTLKTVNFSLTPSIIYLTVTPSSSQFSRGETAEFTINVTNARGQSIASNITSVTVSMKGPNNETRNLIPTREGSDFVALYKILDNETMGLWTVTASVTDTFGNHAEAVESVTILEAFWIQFYPDSSTYTRNEIVNFTAYVSRYSNLTNFLNSSEVVASVNVLGPQNTTVATFNLTTFGNALTGKLNATNLIKGVYDAYLTVRDSAGDIYNASTTFEIVQDFSITVNTNRATYNRTETVQIYGSILFANGTPATDTSVLMNLVVKGYQRSFYATTNSSGIFEYYFHPLGVDAGNYTVTCSSNIDGITRQSTGHFVLLGLELSPSTLTISMSENSETNFTIQILNTGETRLTGITTTITPASIGGVLLATIGYPQSTITAGGFTVIVIRVSASTGAATNTSFNLTVTCNQGAIEFSVIAVDLYPATPVLQVTPQLIDISIAPDNFSTQTISVTNIGYGTLKNATLTAPANPWITTTTESLGDICPQGVKSFDILIQPSNSTPIGLYQDKITILSQDYISVNVYIIVKVTTATNGTLLFRVIDDSNSPVSNAMVTLQYQEYWLQAQNAFTNSTGYCVFSSLFGGSYSYVVSAENHQTVSGVTTVQPGSTVYVQVVAPLQIMQVIFNVVPIQIEDQYVVVLNMTFETAVPPPLLVPIPPVVQFTADRASVYQNGFDANTTFALTNTGSIAVFNVSISVEDSLPNGYNISLGNFGNQWSLPEIAAQNVTTVPCELRVHNGTDITDLTNDVVGRIKIQGYFIYFDKNQNPERAEVESEVLVKIVPAARGLCVNPSIIYVVNHEGWFSFQPGGGTGENLPDVTITNCASAIENVSLFSPALGVLVIAFVGVDVLQLVASLAATLVGLAAFAAGIEPGAILAEAGLDWAADSAKIDVTSFLISGKIVTFGGSGSGILGVVALSPLQSAVLESQTWSPSTSISDFLQDLAGLSWQVGIEASLGAVFFIYQWVGSSPSFYPIPILGVNFYGPSISLPILTGPGSGGSGTAGSLVGYSNNSGYTPPIIKYVAPPNATYTSAPVVQQVQTAPVTTVHEIVKLSISQEATLERDAFTATLQMTSKMTSTTINGVRSSLDISFANGSDASSNFYVNVTSLQGISAIDGTGIIDPQATGTVVWLLIPKPGAGGNNQDGLFYIVQAHIDYFVNETLYQISSSNETINVMPQPQLVVDYYLPQSVQANKPFDLAIKVTNIGSGTANDFTIDSAQPVIYENLAHLRIAFSLIGCYVRGTASTDSLKISFGDIAPGQFEMAYWIMTTTLNGNFTAFTATYTHSNALGGAETSLIQVVNTHILMRGIMLNQTASAFLVAMGNETVPDQLVNSASGACVPVVQAVYNVTHLGSATLTLATQKVLGSWIWINLTDPFNNQKQITQIQRSDGKILNNQDYWMANGRIFIVDDPAQNYTITFATHSLTVWSITSSTSAIVQGGSISAAIMVRNEGNYIETFNVTLYGSLYGQSWPLYTFINVILAPNQTLTLTINGLGFGAGYYTLSARVYNAYVNTTYTGVTVLVAPIAKFRPWNWLCIGGGSYRVRRRHSATPA